MFFYNLAGHIGVISFVIITWPEAVDNVVELERASISPRTNFQFGSFSRLIPHNQRVRVSQQLWFGNSALDAAAALLHVSLFEDGPLGHVIEKSIDPPAALVQLGNDGPHRRVFRACHFSNLAHGFVQDEYVECDIDSLGLGEFLAVGELISYCHGMAGSRTLVTTSMQEYLLRCESKGDPRNFHPAFISLKPDPLRSDVSRSCKYLVQCLYKWVVFNARIL